MGLNINPPPLRLSFAQLAVTLSFASAWLVQLDQMCMAMGAPERMGAGSHQMKAQRALPHGHEEGGGVQVNQFGPLVQVCQYGRCQGATLICPAFCPFIGSGGGDNNSGDGDNDGNGSGNDSGGGGGGSGKHKKKKSHGKNHDKDVGSGGGGGGGGGAGNGGGGGGGGNICIGFCPGQGSGGSGGGGGLGGSSQQPGKAVQQLQASSKAAPFTTGLFCHFDCDFRCAAYCSTH